jgi:alpha-tubulin suppressor-like RCC1 family protein
VVTLVPDQTLFRSEYTCGITPAGRALCWGFGGAGTFGDGTTTPLRTVPSPVPGDRRYAQIATRLAHTCAITVAGRGFCWGNNTVGQLGDGTLQQRLFPRPVGGDLVLSQVSVGFFHTCAVTTTNQAYCWGPNTAGQIGNGTADPSGAGPRLPTPVGAPM